MHSNAAKSKGFTLIELLVVVAIIALLLSILLPSLSGAREQGKRAKCLAALKGLGTAVYQYANEDRAEQPIPIHEMMVKTAKYWEQRCVNWFAWGGRSGQKVFLTAANAGLWLSEEMPPPPGGQVDAVYAARRRPLNNYMVTGVGTGDSKKLEWYQCPSDTGYPDDPDIDDSPGANAKRPCYDTLGNSFRASLNSFTFTTGPVSSAGAFALGPWGHRLSTLQETARTVLFGEPSWFNMIGRDDVDTGQLVPVEGWHKRVLIDNLIFLDGSARAVKVEPQAKFPDDAGEKMGIWNNRMDLLEHRTGSYKLDVYPTGGAIIWDSNGAVMSYISRAPDKWPWRGYQDNLRSK